VFRLSCKGYGVLVVEVEVMLWTFRGDDVVVCSSGEAHQSHRPTGSVERASSTAWHDDASLHSSRLALSTGIQLQH
jgi:hypothetical protein